MKRKTVSIIKACCFTEKAKDLLEKLRSSLPEIIWLPLENKEELNQRTLLKNRFLYFSFLPQELLQE